LAVAFILRASAKVYLFANAADPLTTWNEYQAWVTYANDPAVKDKPDLKAKFQKAISEQLAKAASHNREVTELRNQFLQRAIKAGLIAGVILIASKLSFVIKKYADPDEGPVRVEIVSPIKINMSDNKPPPTPPPEPSKDPSFTTLGRFREERGFPTPPPPKATPPPAPPAPPPPKK
jgi:hypothetical protein